jgi:UDP-N-acetylmuramyl pentapeptide phosphotransferase/UDP-N-acetylglucosamine-1-phosphate transferase
MKKLAAHILCGLIIVLMANIRIKSLHGIFGIYEIPYWASIFLSLFTMIVIINAFNLIDGVDGLAAGIGFIAAGPLALGSCCSKIWLCHAWHLPWRVHYWRFCIITFLLQRFLWVILAPSPSG